MDMKKKENINSQQHLEMESCYAGTHCVYSLSEERFENLFSLTQVFSLRKSFVYTRMPVEFGDGTATLL